MSNKKTLIKESVIRRWGKLANMPALTENFLDSIETIEEEEMEMDAEEKPDMDAGGEASPAEEETVEKIVSAVVDAIAQETGVDIEVEGEAGDEEGGMEMEMGDDDDDAAMRDPAMRDPAMRDPAMRDVEEAMHKGKDKDEKAAMRDDDKKAAMRDDKKAAMRDDKDEDEKAAMRDDKKMKKEELDLEVIDDEELTEAVLKRVVERLLRRK